MAVNSIHVMCSPARKHPTHYYSAKNCFFIEAETFPISIVLAFFSSGTTLSKNNFVTTFNFIEENGAIGSSNILENTTTFNFDKQNFVSFRTRKNREIDLTEYYDLIYEYKNDCLVAGIKYNKTYYNDRDLEPTEDLMLSISLIPLTSIEQKVAN